VGKHAVGRHNDDQSRTEALRRVERAGGAACRIAVGQLLAWALRHWLGG
jgi:hypothetical protein